MYIKDTGYGFAIFKNGVMIPGTERVTYEEAEELKDELEKGENNDTELE